MAQDAGERDRDRGTDEVAAPPVAEPVVRTVPDHDDAPASDGRTTPHPAQDDAAAPALGRNPEADEASLPPHEPGSMDISHHEETYQAFVRLTMRAVVTIFVVLMLLALINA